MPTATRTTSFKLIQNVDRYLSELKPTHIATATIMVKFLINFTVA
jgi:hypothetical protein